MARSAQEETDIVSTGLRLMAVHAHPDDESSKGAAATAYYRSRGAEVMVVSCTGGERGDVLNAKLAHNPEVLRDLTAYRRREMAEAQRILDCQHTWLGFVDSGLPEGEPLPPLPPGCFALEPLEVTSEALVRVIRSFRPHVITTYDEKGGYPHPDHIMTHNVSVAAFRAAGDPRRFPHAGPAWQPLKMYYNAGMSKGRISAFHHALIEAGMESPYGEWLEHLKKRPERTVTTRISCAEFFGVRNDALRAHATQIDPDSFWFAMPLELEQQVWPYDCFELAVSYVPFMEGEDDLFAGLGDAEHADCLARGAVASGEPPVYDEVKEAVWDTKEQ